MFDCPVMDFDPKQFIPLMRPWGRVVYPNVSPLDRLAVAHAQRLRAREDAIRCGGLTQTYAELAFQNNADHTAVASTNAEATLLAGTNKQPKIPAFSMENNGPFAKGFSIQAAGVLGSTGTPTYIWRVRISTTAGSGTLSGSVLGVNAAATAGSGVSTKEWELWLHVAVNTYGVGAGNTTLSCYGYVESPSGLAAPYKYAMQPTTPESDTWTQTCDGGLTQYINVSVTPSASDPANTVKCKALRLYAWN